MHSFERKITIPEFKNEFQVTEDDKTFIYSGSFRYFKFIGCNIRCYVEIEKHVLVDDVTYKRFHKDQIKKVETRRQQVWSFGQDSYIVKDGQPATDYLNHLHYRSALRSDALQKEMDLPPELFDKVFDSIDEQVMEFYDTVLGSKSSLHNKKGDNDAR